MRAWQAIAYGSARHSLFLREAPLPRPAAGEVLVKVAAASLNPIDYKLLRGDLRVVQRLRFPFVPGFDAAGVVAGIGEGADRFRVGDEVFLRASRDTLGAFAEYTVQPEAFIALRPRNVDMVGAASLPLVALTTVQALVDRAQARPGQRLLVHAGAGGLGSFAIQYAKHLGLVVETTTSAKNADWVRSLGADRVICYDREDYRQGGVAYDIVFDTLGGEHVLAGFEVLKPGGVLVSVAGPPDREMAARFGSNPLLRLAMWAMSRKAYAAARRRNARYYRFLTESSGAQLADIARLVEQGLVQPRIDSVFAFADAVAAYERLAAGRARGKIVLELS
jgi:NADPH:quinone reductase-like Zn-dependent oxidoreductase